MSALRTVTAAAAIGLSLIGPARSQPATASTTPWFEVQGSRVRLVAGPSAAAPGRPHLAAVEIELAEGWKTYWRMPGDAGVPPAFDWKGSANAGAIKVLYPAPARLPEAGGEAIGYKRAVVFPIEVTAQDPAKPVNLKLALEFGICREICIPAETTFNLSLPPGRAGAIPREIAAALERVPRAQASRRKDDPKLEGVAVNRSGGLPQLTVDARFAGNAKGADLFIEAPDGLYVPLPKKVADPAGGISRFAVELSRDLERDLQGKTLTLTLVSDAGASEGQWTFP